MLNMGRELNDINQVVAAIPVIVFLGFATINWYFSFSSGP